MGAANQTTVTLVPPHGISSVVSFRISRRCMVEFSSRPGMKARRCGTTCASDGGRCKPSGPPWQPQRNEVKVANFDCLFLMKKQVAQADEDEGIDFTDVREVTDFSQAKRLSEYGTVADALLQNYSLQADGVFFRIVNSARGVAFICSISWPIWASVVS